MMDDGCFSCEGAMPKQQERGMDGLDSNKKSDCCEKKGRRDNKRWSMNE
jgi:hypothetical protein